MKKLSDQEFREIDDIITYSTMQGRKAMYEKLLNEGTIKQNIELHRTIQQLLYEKEDLVLQLRQNRNE